MSSVSRSLALVLALIALAGCGRKGDLDAPSAASQAPQSGQVGIGQTDTPPPPPVEDRRFILDGLI